MVGFVIFGIFDGNKIGSFVVIVWLNLFGKKIEYVLYLGIYGKMVLFEFVMILISCL